MLKTLAIRCLVILGGLFLSVPIVTAQDSGSDSRLPIFPENRAGLSKPAPPERGLASPPPSAKPDGASPSTLSSFADSPAESLAGPLREDPFEPILQAYHAGEFAEAVSKTSHLLESLSVGPLAETASFLIGDLHLAWAERDGAEHFHQALAAFRNAQRTYPDTENTVRAFLRTGQAYLGLGLYYESIGSFKRVLTKHPHSRFAPSAKMKIAQAYQAWQKWKEADAAYRQIDPSSFSGEEGSWLSFGHAEVLFHLGRYESAYKKYEGAVPRGETGNTPVPLRLLPILFQYGEVAYRTGRTAKAREIFSRFLKTASQNKMAIDQMAPDPLVPIALARMGDAWRMEGKDQEAGQVYQQVLSLGASHPNATAARMLASAGQLAMRPCGAHPGQKAFPDCLSEQYREEIRPLLDTIEKEGLTLLHAPPVSPLHQELILETVERLQAYGAFPTTVALEEAFLPIPLSPPLRLRLTVLSRKTIIKEIDRLSGEKEDLRILSIFHSRSADFIPSMLTGRTGLQVALSHVRVGLHAQAIELLAPIAASPSNRLAETALFHLGRSLLSMGDNPRAEQKLNQFLRRYPKSRHAPEVLADSAIALDRQDRLDQAIARYETWFRRYPENPDRERMAFFLAKAYQRKGDFKKEALVYQTLQTRIKGNSLKSLDLTLAIAEVSLQLGAFAKALPAYQAALKEKGEGEEADWIRFQMAKCYRGLGEKARGRALLDLLAQKAQDPSLRAWAAEEKELLHLLDATHDTRRKTS